MLSLNIPTTITLILILILTLPQAKDPIISLTLTLSYPRSMAGAIDARANVVSPSGYKPHACDQCEKVFCGITSLTRHTHSYRIVVPCMYVINAIMHKLEQVVSPNTNALIQVRRLVCDQCGKAFFF